MTKVDENIKSAQNLLSGIVERCHELEEENKGLREMLKSNGQMVTMRESTIYRLEEENYKLEEENRNLKLIQETNEKQIQNDIKERDELREENKKLKYVIDLAMEEAGIEYIRLADGDVFTNPKNKLHISNTIQIDILNHKQQRGK